MSAIEIPVVHAKELHASASERKRCTNLIGDSLRDIGFFAVADHEIMHGELLAAYESAQEFFSLRDREKKEYEPPGVAGQRGYTSFGTEHARDSESADLKEFFQVGRVEVGDEHPVHKVFGPNLWPAEVPQMQEHISQLYKKLDALGRSILRACSLYLGEPETELADMVEGGDTILRILHYPPLPNHVPEGAIRAAAHEDINLITLLPGATDTGLELLGRDGNWLSVEAAHDHIIVDAGDMLQNLSNGLLRSTTHRVVNPVGSNDSRYSMPCFLHPRREADLSPRVESIRRTGGTAKYPSTTAGKYLDKRLAEIGLRT